MTTNDEKFECMVNGVDKLMVAMSTMKRALKDAGHLDAAGIAEIELKLNEAQTILSTVHRPESFGPRRRN